MAISKPNNMIIMVDIKNHVKICEFVEVKLYEMLIQEVGIVVNVEKLNGVDCIVIMVSGPQFHEQVRNGYVILCEFKGFPAIIKFSTSQNIFNGLGIISHP